MGTRMRGIWADKGRKFIAEDDWGGFEIRGREEGIIEVRRMEGGRISKNE